MNWPARANLVIYDNVQFHCGDVLNLGLYYPGLVWLSHPSFVRNNYGLGDLTRTLQPRIPFHPWKGVRHMSLGASDISAPTLHMQCQWHPMSSPNPALFLVWKRVEIRPDVLRFSLLSPRHSWDLSVTCLVSFSGIWSSFLRENNPVFPWEEV